MPERTGKPVERDMPMPDPDFGGDPISSETAETIAARRRMMLEAREERVELARARRRRKIVVAMAGFGQAALSLVLWRVVGLIGLFVGLEPLSVYALFHLWRRRDAKLWKRIVWTPIALVPFFGPIVYGGLYDPPPPTGEDGGEHVRVIGSPGKNYL
jgi:hypothetical protein